MVFWMYVFFIIFYLFQILPVYASHLQNYEITVKDGQFNPEKIEVQTGQRFKITIKNIGADPVEFENLSLRVEKVLGSNIRSFLIIPPLKPGIYHFVDEFHLNMMGFNVIAREQ